MTPLLAHPLRADRSFERIYRRHVGDVYRYALAVLRNPSDAEDVAQTTFLNAYRAFQRGERPQNAQNWLIAIAHNVCRQRFRQSARRPDEVAYDDGILDVIPDEDRGPSAEDIQRALGHLAFNQRAALVMRELEGRSYTEIAEILGLSVSAVETLIFRARRALREQLEGSLTCGEAERAISRQLDGRLSRVERGALRGHLRECKECERFARSQRAQRTAIKALAFVPLPTSLTSLFGGGGAAVGGGVAIKAAAVVAAGTVAAGAGYEGAKRADLITPARPAAAVVVDEESTRALVPAAVERPPNAGRAIPSEPAAPKAKVDRRGPKKAVPARAGKKAVEPGPPAHAVAQRRDKAAKRGQGRPPDKVVPPGQAKERSPAAQPVPKAKERKRKPLPVRPNKPPKTKGGGNGGPSAVPTTVTQVLP
jgi:RNA polymerase sigma-70 factor, ECF subfamily